jgi:hypothetical protein
MVPPPFTRISIIWQGGKYQKRNLRAKIADGGIQKFRRRHVESKVKNYPLPSLTLNLLLPIIQHAGSEFLPLNLTGGRIEMEPEERTGTMIPLVTSYSCPGLFRGDPNPF